jgi:hypothetical protein
LWGGRSVDIASHMGVNTENMLAYLSQGQRQRLFTQIGEVMSSLKFWLDVFSLFETGVIRIESRTAEEVYIPCHILGLY